MSAPVSSRRTRSLINSRFAVNANTLRGRLVLGVGTGAFLLLVMLVMLATRSLTRFVTEQSDIRLLDAGRRSGVLIDRLLAERSRQVTLLGMDAALVAAVKEGSTRARQLGLPGMPTDALERRFDATRSLAIGGSADPLVGRLGRYLDIAELIVTEDHGYNVLTSHTTTDFVQSDEEWWTRSIRDGLTPATAAYDESAGRVVVSIAAAVRENTSSTPLGAVKASFTLTSLDEAIARASAPSGIQVDVIDATGHIVASSSNVPRMRTMRGFSGLDAAGRDSIIGFDDGSARRRAVVLFTNGGQWRLVAHALEEGGVQALDDARRALWAGAAALLVFMVIALWLVGRYVGRRVSEPALELAAIAEAVAGGDLSVRVGSGDSDDEIGRLRRATDAMIRELRRLAGALKSSSYETAAMSSEITAGAEEMSAAAQQMAQTSNDLSQRSAEMAGVIREAAGDATRLKVATEQLTTGARQGVERNAALRTLAQDNRTRLDESVRTLDTLASEVQSNAAAVDALAVASEEVQAFVTLVRKVARQSKLLALNAAMEAARAGEQGQGFAVVASEVRRLAANTTEAAERTEILVRDVVGRIEQSRSTSAKAVDTVKTVLAATHHGLNSFAEIEQAVVNAEGWTAEIERAATMSSGFVASMNTRLENLSRGTEGFAAAMEQVAASSEEQSASTEEIAAAAEALAAAADRLSKLIATFKLGDESVTTEHRSPPPTAEWTPAAAVPAPAT